MARCPNCGQKARGNFCQWCGYPIVESVPASRQREKWYAEERARLEAKERAIQEAEEAKERAIQEAEEAQRAKEARRQAEREAKEQAKKEAQEAKERAKQEAKEVREKAIREAEEAQRAKEARKQAEREAKEQAKKEAKDRAKQEAKEAEEKAKKEAEEAKRTEEAEKQAEGEAKERAKKEAKEAEEKAKEEVSPPPAVKFYKGVVRLTVLPPIDLARMESFKVDLGRVENLHMLLVGGSAEGGNTIIVSIDKPLPLFDIMRELPAVEQVISKGDQIEVTLKVG